MPDKPDRDEPRRISEIIMTPKQKHYVIISVAKDDMAHEGALFIARECLAW